MALSELAGATTGQNSPRSGQASNRLALIPSSWPAPRTSSSGGTNRGASQARGFCSYLQTTAVQQACSAGQPGLLYDYMPYAIAFGCTGQWDTMSAALPEDAGPAWYQSHLGPSALTTSFIPAIHHFAAAATSSGPPGGSGPAGGSGFSGGAAGGGGGGGGGSW